MSIFGKFEDKKASFAEMLDAEDKALHNSNMLNLVHAVRGIDSELEEIGKRTIQLRALKEEIVTFADGDDIQNTDKVKELFNKSREIRDQVAKRTRW